MAHEAPEYYRRQPGDLILCTQGEYSDYTLEGVFRVLQAVDLAHEVRHYTTTLEAGTSFKARRFVEYLLTRGRLAPVAADEIYLGDGNGLIPCWARVPDQA